MRLPGKWIVGVGDRNPTILLETLEADKGLVTSEAWTVSWLWNGHRMLCCLLPSPQPFLPLHDLFHGKPKGDVKWGTQDSSRTQTLGQTYKTCHPNSYIKDQVYSNQSLIMYYFIPNSLCNQRINNRPTAHWYARCNYQIDALLQKLAIDSSKQCLCGYQLISVIELLNVTYPSWTNLL